VRVAAGVAVGATVGVANGEVEDVGVASGEVGDVGLGLGVAVGEGVGAGCVGVGEGVGAACVVVGVGVGVGITTSKRAAAIAMGEVSSVGQVAGSLLQSRSPHDARTR